MISGRLARDPESKTAPSGTTVTNFTLAVDGYNPSTKTREAEFFRVVAFGARGENIQKFCQKGRLLTVRYKLGKNEWTDKQGNKHNDVTIIVEDFDLGPSPAGNQQPQQQDEWTQGPPQQQEDPSWDPNDPFGLGA